MRFNANDWGVQRRQRAEGKLRDKPDNQVEQELRAAIRGALSKWLARRSPQAAAEISSSSRSSSSGGVAGTLPQVVLQSMLVDKSERLASAVPVERLVLFQTVLLQSTTSHVASRIRAAARDRCSFRRTPAPRLHWNGSRNKAVRPLLMHY